LSETIQIEEWQLSDELVLTKNDLDFLNNRVNGGKINSKIEIIPKGESQFQLKATSWVGTVKIPNSHTIIVKPKVGNLNFIKMLVYAEDLEGIEFFDLVTASEGEFLVDFMARLFIQLIKPIAEEGIYKSYVTITEEIPSVKGRLLLAQNIRHPRLTHEKFWCEYDELSTDILENQILLYCTKLFSVLVKNYSIRSDLHNFQSILESEGVSEIYLEPYHLDLISLQKMNEHYEQALKLCEFILRFAWYHDFAKEETLPIYGFLYDMNELFQNFVTKVVKETFPDYNVYKEPANYDLLESITVKESEEQFDTTRVRLLPDIVIEDKKSKTILVIDTKYKESVTNNDIYQATAYSLTLECPVLLLVPQIYNRIQESFRIKPIYKKSAQIHIKSVDFSDTENYIEEMRRRISKELTNTVQALNSSSELIEI